MYRVSRKIMYSVPCPMLLSGSVAGSGVQAIASHRLSQFLVWFAFWQSSIGETEGFRLNLTRR